TGTSRDLCPDASVSYSPLATGGARGTLESAGRDPALTAKREMTMKVIHRQHHINTEGVTTSEVEEVANVNLARALAALRISFGITFLWAFLDKTFALGFHTGYDQEGNLDRFGDAAWINGASPTEGFLSFAIPENNPFKGFFNGLAGYAVVDWLFMLGL